MTDKHTPGPWKVITLDGDTYINPARSSGEYALIARVQRNHKSRPANARLIAAAPELLKRLAALMSLGDVHQKDEWAKDFDLAEAAIKAAKGDA